MLREKRFELSRNHWKRAAVRRGTALREQRKTILRHRNRIEAQQAEIARLTEEQKKSPPRL